MVAPGAPVVVLSSFADDLLKRRVIVLCLCLCMRDFVCVCVQSLFVLTKESGREGAQGICVERRSGFVCPLPLVTKGI